jgi:hypothetical protein
MLTVNPLMTLGTKCHYYLQFAERLEYWPKVTQQEVAEQVCVTQVAFVLAQRD